MLPKARRIDKTTFKTLNGRGMSYHSPLLFLSVYKQQNEKSLSRFAVLCSKKVSSSAVDRNRQRRRVYRSLQGILPHTKPGFFGILTVKKEGKESDFVDLDRFVKKLLINAHVLNT